MKNFELIILNQWGEEEYCFFVQSNKTEEEIMADYKQAIDVLDDKGYHIYIQERTFKTTLPSLQDMLEVLGEAEDDWLLVHLNGEIGFVKKDYTISILDKILSIFLTKVSSTKRFLLF